jgi:hypothetical protein
VSTVAEKDGRVTSWLDQGIDHDGKKNEKNSVHNAFAFAMATQRSLAKASVDPGCTSLIDSEDLKVMSTDQERIHDG